MEKNFAEKLLNFLTEEFNNGYNTKTQKNFINHMDHMFKNGFKTSWSLGGTHGNCYGEKTESSAEMETDLTQLDDFIMSQYPNIGFMQYKMIERSITKNVQNDSDWYGGETKTASKEIDFGTLANVVVKVKMEEGREFVNVKELVEATAAELFPEKSKTIKMENSEVTDFGKSLAKGMAEPQAVKKTLGIADEKKIRKPKDVVDKVVKTPRKKM